MKKILAALLLTSALHAKEVSLNTLDDTVRTTLSYWQVPGCAVAIVQGDQVILTRGYGKKRVDMSDTIDAHTLFPIASLTKQFTAAAVGKLVSAGTCTFDDKMLAYFPSLILTSPHATDHITLRDCLNMSSGLAGASINPKYAPNPALSTRDLLDLDLPNVPFPQGFRGMFSYQNYNYLLAATVFESTPQKTWQNYLYSQIFAPRKMNETLSAFASFQKAPNKAHPHQWKTSNFVEVPFENLTNIAPAAGLFSTASDLSRWLVALTTGTIPPPTLYTSQVVATPQGYFPPDELYMQDIYFPTKQFLTYGFGWFIYDYRGIKILQAPGITDGYTPTLAYIPSLALGIAILPNAESAPFTNALLYQLIDHYLGARNNWNQLFNTILETNKAPTSHK